jgi:RNAse (barnase) inhibitor barstar
MSLDSLFAPKKQWFYLLTMSHPALAGWIDSLDSESPPDAVVRTLRGTKMRSFQGLFQEFSAGLQFPAYFGQNFNALRDCLADLEWLPAEAYVVVLSDAEQLLYEEREEDFGALIQLLRIVCEEWNEPVWQGEEWDRPSVPFHVVLHTLPEHAVAFGAKLRNAGAMQGELRPK